MNRRHLLLVALVILGLSSVAGVESVSSVSADRDVSVAVADDSEAYLGISIEPTSGTATLTLTNRISTAPLVITVDDGGATVSQTLGPGELATFDVSCDGEVHVSADAPDAEVDATRSVDCPETGSGDSDGDSDEGDEGSDERSADDGDEDAGDDVEDDGEGEVDGGEDDDDDRDDAGSGDDDE